MTVVGGPDLAAVVERQAVPGGTVLRVTLGNGGPVPAQVQRVAVPIESVPLRRVSAHGWSAAEPCPTAVPGAAGIVGAPFVVSDRGTVGWLGSARHRGVVEVQRDGWLLTAWADLAGIIIGPGETLPLDPLFVGDDSPEGYPRFAAAWAAELPALRALPASRVEVLSPGVSASARAEGAVLVARRVADLAAVVAEAGRAGVPAGVVSAPFADGPEPLDLTRPEALAAVADTGRRLCDAGATWVIVVGAGDASTPRPRWGDAAVTPPAALRHGLEALRLGLGPEPVIHVAGGPLAPVAGAADVVDAGPGWSAGPGWLEPVGARLPLHGSVWHASPGPVPPDLPTEEHARARELSGPLAVWH